MKKSLRTLICQVFLVIGKPLREVIRRYALWLRLPSVNASSVYSFYDWSLNEGQGVWRSHQIITSDYVRCTRRRSQRRICSVLKFIAINAAQTLAS